MSISQDTCWPCVVVDPGMRRSLLLGNREIFIAVPVSRGRDVVGKLEAAAEDERAGEVGPARSSAEASE